MADLKGVKPRKKDEREFDRAMRTAYLIPFLQGLERRLKDQPYLGTLGWIGVVGSYVAAWERNQNISFPTGTVEKWASKINTYHEARFIRDFQRAMVVDIRPLLNSGAVQPVLRQAVHDSIGLIKTIPSEFHKNLSAKYIKGESEAPLDLAAREQLFRETGKSSGYKLRRITRDQTNKLYGKLTESRQQQAGINEYEWDTSEDDRVRPTHEIKQGHKFRWDSPPSDTGHPGHDIQCRCVAIPVVIAEELRSRVR